MIGTVGAPCMFCADYVSVSGRSASYGSVSACNWDPLTSTPSNSGTGSVCVPTSAVGGRLDCIDWERCIGSVLDAAEFLALFADGDSSSRSASGSTASITITSVAAPSDGSAWGATADVAGSDRA